MCSALLKMYNERGIGYVNIYRKRKGSVYFQDLMPGSGTVVQGLMWKNQPSKCEKTHN